MKLSKNSTKNMPDAKLASLVKTGNKEAYAELVHRHLTPVFRLSYSLLHDAGRAEDITQDTFMTLWEDAEKYQPTGQFKSWLFRIARNKSIDDIRRQKPNTDIEDAALTDQQKSPHALTLDHQVTAIIDTQIKTLPPRQREAIMLVHFLECSNIEAADIMQISVDALESLLARGRKKLKTLLKDHTDLIPNGEHNEQ